MLDEAAVFTSVFQKGKIETMDLIYLLDILFFVFIAPIKYFKIFFLRGSEHYR